jgi:hypothetical protein
MTTNRMKAPCSASSRAAVVLGLVVGLFGLLAVPQASLAQFDVNAACVEEVNKHINGGDLGQKIKDNTKLTTKETSGSDLYTVAKKAREGTTFLTKWPKFDSVDFGNHVLEGICAKGSTQTGKVGIFQVDQKCFEQIDKAFKTNSATSGARIGAALDKIKFQWNGTGPFYGHWGWANSARGSAQLAKFETLAEFGGHIMDGFCAN